MTADDRIKAIVTSDTFARQLEISSPEDLQVRFGKADEIKPNFWDVEGMNDPPKLLWNTYYFYSKHISAVRVPDQRLIARVTVSE